MIGKSPLARDSPLIVGSIDDEEYHVLAGIAKRHPSWLIDRLLQVFDDHYYGMEELALGAELLDQLLLEEKESRERAVLYMFSAVFSMALRRGLPLHGVAD